MIALRLFAVGALAALAAGVLGAWVDRTSPNPVYGWQVITLGLALVLAIIGAFVLRRGPIGQAFAVASFAGLLGVYVGINYFGVPRPQYSSGAMTLRLERPFDISSTAAARCITEGESMSVGADLEPLPIEVEHRFALFVREAEPDGYSRADGRGLEIIVEEMMWGSDEETRVVSLYATDSSDLEGEYRADGGHFRFAGLSDEPNGGGRPAGLDDLDFAGTVEWSCTGDR